MEQTVRPPEGTEQSLTSGMCLQGDWLLKHVGTWECPWYLPELTFTVPVSPGKAGRAVQTFLTSGVQVQPPPSTPLPMALLFSLGLLKLSLTCQAFLKMAD